MRFEQARRAPRQKIVSSEASIGAEVHVLPLRSDFWSDFYGPHAEHDLALAQTMRTVRAIRGTEPPPAGVQEELRAGLAHLCAAMEGLVEWMEQERRADPEALQLIASLRKIGDDVVRCLSASPLKMILPRGSTGFE